MQGYGSAVTYARHLWVDVHGWHCAGRRRWQRMPRRQRWLSSARSTSAPTSLQLMGMIESTASDPAKLAQWLGVKMLEDLNVHQLGAGHDAAFARRSPRERMMAAAQ